jgi:hypothetical protein
LLILRLCGKKKRRFLSLCSFCAFVVKKKAVHFKKGRHNIFFIPLCRVIKTCN